MAALLAQRHLSSRVFGLVAERTDAPRPAPRITRYGHALPSRADKPTVFAQCYCLRCASSRAVTRGEIYCVRIVLLPARCVVTRRYSRRNHCVRIVLLPALCAVTRRHAPSRAVTRGETYCVRTVLLPALCVVTRRYSRRKPLCSHSAIACAVRRHAWRKLLCSHSAIGCVTRGHARSCAVMRGGKTTVFAQCYCLRFGSRAVTRGGKTTVFAQCFFLRAVDAIVGRARMRGEGALAALGARKLLCSHSAFSCAQSMR